MGLFGNMLTWGKARSDEAAEKIEDADPIGFAKQAIKELEDERNKARGNVGKMKAEKLALQRDIKEEEDEFKELRAKAKTLKGKKPELALKVANKAADVQESFEQKKSSLKMIADNLEKQKTNFGKLDTAVDKANRDLKAMKSMEQVTKSTQALVQVNAGSGDSALAKFEAKKKKLRKKLDEAEATNEMANDSLDSEVESALGTPSKGASLLDSL